MHGDIEIPADTNEGFVIGAVAIAVGAGLLKKAFSKKKKKK